MQTTLLLILSMRKFTLLLCAGLACFAAGQVMASPQKSFISIGTGGLTGVYYPTGGAICRLLNRNRKKHGIRCSAESTGGSIFNINAIRSNDIEFGVAQSDWQYHAYHGSSTFEKQGAMKNLRAVFSLHSEPFSVVARTDSGIRNFDDIRGKRINIGNPGSGQRGTMEVVMKAKGLEKSDFKLASELKASEQSLALCDNKIDAIVYAVGHPNASIKEATTSCSSRLVNVTGKTIDSLINEHPFYALALIPGGMYRGNDNETRTFGVKATLVTRSEVDESIVYQLVKAVFDNLDAFKKLHPAFSTLDKKSMLQGLSAPLHEGAIKYYKENGLLK